MPVNYVKFQRGSQSAYDALKTAGSLDNNTLYFIYSEDNSSVGALYMGNRIISGGDITIASATLDDLADVITVGAGTNSLLVKDENGNWVAKTPADIAGLIQEHLAPPTPVSKIYQVTLNNEETYEQAIVRILNGAAPNTSDLVIIRELIVNDKYKTVPYIYNGEAWIAINDKYNANEVYLASNLVITNTEGAEVKSLETAGKSLEEALNLIFKGIEDTSVNGDNVSIEVINGLIQLKDFGAGYYAYVPADESAGTPASYQYTEGFKEGLEPKVRLGTGNVLEIAWYEPVSEVLDTKIENITTTVESIQTQIGSPSTETTEASGLYGETERLANEKANKTDVYTKTETDLAISTAIVGADHLKRKIVNSVDEIDVNATDALQYIYMVPTGLQFEDDKYDEYIVIDYTATDGEETTSRLLERVGSWEVDLSNYATKTDLEAKADKSTTLAGYGITDTYTKTEITNLIADITGGESAADVLAGLNEYKTANDTRVGNLEKQVNELDLGEKNYIAGVSSDFTVNQERVLSLNDIAMDKVTGLNVLQSTVQDLSSQVADIKVQYVSVADFNSVVGDLKTMKENNVNILNDITVLQDCLRWKEMETN